MNMFSKPGYSSIFKKIVLPVLNNSIVSYLCGLVINKQNLKSDKSIKTPTESSSRTPSLTTVPSQKCNERHSRYIAHYSSTLYINYL